MSDTELSTERLTWIYTQMLRIREFEERVKRSFEEHPGVIRGHTHLADGEFCSFLARCGLPFFDTVTTMSLGGEFRDPNDRSGKTPVTYALASQALG